MTIRLYSEDPYLNEFQAKVTAHHSEGGRIAVVLDRTAFYPTSGGQPHDLGTLNNVKVLEVVEREGEILHFLAEPMVAEEVKGAIQPARRRDLMQQHHGQHILSESFQRVADASTLSFHLGDEICSIELDRDLIPLEELEKAQEMANAIVNEGRQVVTKIYSRAECDKLALRKLPPEEEERVRIVHIEGFDAQPCCGTHPRKTSEVGAILILNSERERGKTRVHFVCGFRAIEYARQNCEILRIVGATLSSAREGIIDAVEKMSGDLADARKGLFLAEKFRMEAEAAEIADRAPKVGSVRISRSLWRGKDMKYLQGVARGVVSRPGMVVLFGATGEGTQMVLARSKDVQVDLRPVLKKALSLIDGRGGGAPAFCQGGGPGDDLAGALEKAEENIVAILAD